MTSRLNEHRLSTIILWTNSEMQPVAAALIAFNEQLVIILLGLIGIKASYLGTSSKQTMIFVPVTAQKSLTKSVFSPVKSTPPSLQFLKLT